MASKTQSTNVTQQKKVYVKSEDAFQEMQKNGQLEPLTDYYTPDDGDAVFMPVGAIFSSAIPQTDARVHLLDGSTISQSGMYAEFATLLKTLVSSGYAISCSASEYNTQLNTYGQCGKFVIDNSAGTIRLPKITKFVEGLTNLANIGQSFSAGIPNITGQPAVSTWWTVDNDVQGAFSTSGSRDICSNNNTAQNLIFDASRGETKMDGTIRNDVYGKSDTVQPQSTAYPYYIVLAGGYKSAEQVNIDNIASDFGVLQNQFNNFHLYQHDIVLSTDSHRICVKVMNNSPTEFTISTFERYLYDNGFTSTTRDNRYGWHTCSGGSLTGGASFVAISSSSAVGDGSFDLLYTFYNQSMLATALSPNTIWDRVTKIF